MSGSMNWRLKLLDKYRDSLHCADIGTLPRLCVGGPPVKNICEHTVANCDHEVGDLPSVTGLLGHFSANGIQIHVVHVAVWLALIVVALCWLVYLASAGVAVALAMKRHCTCSKFRSWTLGLKASLSSSLKRVRQWGFEDPFEGLPEHMQTHAHEVLEKQRLARFRMASMCIFIVGPMILMSDVRQNQYVYGHFERVVWPSVAPEETPEMRWLRGLRTEQHVVSWATGPALVLLCCAVATLRPERVSGALVSATHISLFIGMAVHLSDMGWLEEFTTYQTGFFVLLRAASAVLDGNTRNVVILNSLLSVLQTMALITAAPFARHEVWGADEVRDDMLREIIVSTLVICMVAAVLDGARRDLVKQLLRADRKEEEATTVRSMLGLMCDAVVELVNGCTVAPNPQLAGLTLRSSPTGLSGKLFADLVHRDDHQRCLDALSERITKCSMLHIRLIDGLGASVPVQLFIALNQGRKSDTVEHVIGIREDNDPGTMRIPDAPDFSSGSHPVARRLGPRRNLDSLPEGRATSEFTGTQVSVRSCPAGWPALPFVWVRPAQEYKIVRASGCFIDAVGQSSLNQTADFRSWIQSEKACKQFMDFASQILNAPEKQAGDTFKGLRLKTPGMDCFVVMTLTYLFLECSVEDDEEDMAFLVTNIRYTKKGRRREEPPMPQQQSSLQL
eukprot:TRINITY_DN8314_c0_g1_i2.p1 TRINITY_DN8314_c0_g1~~TRINITY_DN8314_c0_g1_i2.p1  ORF type:complete len:676 (+),score=69.41 TRINITY_DN8314_c0_g1_i2:72-2099(+)